MIIKEIAEYYINNGYEMPLCTKCGLIDIARSKLPPTQLIPDKDGPKIYNHMICSCGDMPCCP